MSGVWCPVVTNNCELFYEDLESLKIIEILCTVLDYVRAQVLTPAEYQIDEIIRHSISVFKNYETAVIPDKVIPVR